MKSFFSKVSLIVLSLSCTAFAYDKDALAGWFLGLKPEKVVYAVNCGSIDSLTDAVGVTYAAVSFEILLINSLIGRELCRGCNVRRGPVPPMDPAQFRNLSHRKIRPWRNLQVPNPRSQRRRIHLDP